MNQVHAIAAPLGRILLALIFITSGFSKISGYAATQGYMEAMGVPGALLPVVIAVELLGGLAVMLGWQTRVAAFLLAGFSLLSAVLFHADFGDQMQMIMFMKNVSIAGGFLMLVSLGGGAFALDNRSASRR
ncbi:MAG: DoxX family protein [Xanthomonadales bacterium]|nr:DoxX family protein [Gammaproteobacteria bacterium]MBT8073720.1 DoxX family protein [Gammaproteobacteria bacterium]NNK04566.1 DoxX family protein [Xanthomonadales bacterium]